jgi:transposase-like protein
LSQTRFGTAVYQSSEHEGEMVKTWDTNESPDITCDSCGSVYAVRTLHLPTRDSDKFNCEVCGKLLREWNSAHVPEFQLKTRGTGTGQSAA